MATTKKSEKQNELGPVDFAKRREEIREREERIAAEKAELAQQELEYHKQNAERTIREVQIALEEIAAKVAPLIASNVWNWRSGAFDQALENMELQPEGAAPITITDEFKKSVLDAIADGELKIDALATKIGQKPGSIRQRISALVEQGILSATDDPAHSGKGRAPKLYRKGISAAAAA